MASSNYTTNLHLSAWSDSDRPKRADFVSDNAIIDSQLGGHILNGSIHLTADEKQKVTEPYVLKTYSGSGSESRTIILDFAPKMVIVYKRNTAPIMYENGDTVVNCGIAGYGASGSGGISVSGKNVTLHETTASSGSRVSLNASGSQYTLIAFR